MKIRALLVDDEEHAIARLKQLCADHPRIVVVGEARSGAEAIDKIRILGPTLVLLDVHLGAMSGLDVLASLDPDDLPFVIFMTAYDTYAASAFERDAVDYLLKPCTPDRFARAIAKLSPHLERGGTGRREEMISAWRALMTSGPLSAAGRREGLYVEEGGRYVFVELASIDYIEAARNYVVIHVGSKSYCHRTAISALEQALDPMRYVRIHKSTIVNLDRVASIEHEFNGVYVVHLAGGATCRSGQSYRSRIHDLLRPTLSRSGAQG